MTAGERAAGLVPWVLASLMLAGIVHLSSVLLMPRVAPRDAFGQLAAFVVPGGLRALPVPEPGQEVLPLLDPAFAYAVCGYDLATGPLRVQASLAAGAFVSMSFHSRRGLVYYSFTDRAASRGKIEVRVLTVSQLVQVEAQDKDDEPIEELRLLAPEAEGFVLLRALATSPSELAAAQGRLAAIGCTATRL